MMDDVVSDSDNQDELLLVCPYCDQDALNKSPLPAQASVYQPTEPVLCLPYSRDIGKFDDGAWSQIGRDFFSDVLGWERIGILRVNPEDIVFYRVAQCRSCNHLFDVFLNCTPGRTLAELWPHLLSPATPPASDAQIERYQGKTLTIGLIESMTSAYETDTLSEVAATLSLSFSLVIVSLALNFLLEWWAVQIDFVSWLQSHFIQIIIQFSGGLWLGLLLLFMFRFAQYLRQTDAFYDLLNVRRKQHITFWLNYTLCRIVGVQDKQVGNNKAKWYETAPTQSGLFGGGLSMALLFLSWFLFHLPSPGEHVTALLAFLPIFVLYAIGAYRETYQSNTKLSPANEAGQRRLLDRISLAAWQAWFKRVLRALLPIKYNGFIWMIPGILVWFLYFAMHIFTSVAGALQSLVNLSFWMIVAYYSGVAMWLGLNSSGYVIRQVQRIPMTLDPLDQFRRLDPLGSVAHRSTQIILVILLGVLVIFVAFSFLAGQHQAITLQWLLAWISVGIAVLLISLGVVIRFYSRSVIEAAVVYLGLMSAVWLTGLDTVVTVQPFDIVIDYRIILTGLFLSYVIYVHTRAAYLPLKGIKVKHQDEMIKHYDELIAKLQKSISDLSSQEPDLNMLGQKTISNLCENMEHLVALRAKIREATTTSWLTANRISVLSPIISAVILPMLINWISGYILQIMLGPP